MAQLLNKDVDLSQLSTGKIPKELKDQLNAAFDEELSYLDEIIKGAPGGKNKRPGVVKTGTDPKTGRRVIMLEDGTVEFDDAD